MNKFLMKISIKKTKQMFAIYIRNVSNISLQDVGGLREHIVFGFLKLMAFFFFFFFKVVLFVVLLCFLICIIIIIIIIIIFNKYISDTDINP